MEIKRRKKKNEGLEGIVCPVYPGITKCNTNRAGLYQLQIWVKSVLSNLCLFWFKYCRWRGRTRQSMWHTLHQISIICPLFRIYYLTLFSSLFPSLDETTITRRKTNAFSYDFSVCLYLRETLNQGIHYDGHEGGSYEGMKEGTHGIEWSRRRFSDL